jgi:starch-binding outer membrane protein, SusD/RagB family
MSLRNTHRSTPVTPGRSAVQITRRVLLVFALAGASGVGACNSLLEADNPAQVPTDLLSDPTLTPPLVAAAIQSLQCGVENFAATAGMLSGEYLSANGFVNNHIWEWRGIVEIKGEPGSCNTGRGTTSMGFYTPLQQARFQLDDEFTRLETFTDAQVPNRGLIMAQMRAYAGYAYLLLGEGMCEMTIDRGPKMTREQTIAIAEERFTDAIARATAVGGAAADSMRHMARVGRARARLDLKKLPDAAADALLVPTGFVRNAEFTEGGQASRENRIYNLTIRNDFLSLGEPYRNMTVNGVSGSVADPRVRSRDAGRNGADGITRVWQQQKFIAQTGATPIPIASWAEAQLIYAEAVGGQLGFDALNRVRAANNVPLLTGTVPTGQAFTDLVLEERRRQLFSEGQRYVDMLRYNLPFQKGTNGVNRKGQTFTDLTCVPLPDVETRNNPNFS